MGKPPTVHQCALCLQTRQLRKSHYLGHAIHRLVSLDHPRGQIVFTPKVITPSPRHLVAHLLCADCEQRFNKLGEGPVLQLLYRDGRFPLLEKMKAAKPIQRDPDVATYSAIELGVDTAALAYFALSLAWRGSVRKWKTLKGQDTGVDLGVHQESIRRYLAGEADLPADISVMVAACSDIGSQLMVNAPWLVETTEGHLQIEMLVRGLWFHVLASPDVPARYRSLCILRSPKRNIYLRDFTDQLLLANRHFLETAEDQVSQPRPRKRGPASTRKP